ncbi:MAG: helix-turn-helix domain-containing protein [Blastocatellia bacterium]
MARRQKDPLREITDDERRWLTRIARSTSEPSTHVARAKQLPAIADGLSYTQAAISSGRKSGDAVAKLVSRFNALGVSAIARKHGGGPKPKYAVAERERILAEARRLPDPDQDGTATWSLMTLRRALRKAPDGLPKVSTYTIRAVLHEAGFRWPRTRSWCETGRVLRKRKSGTVKVYDPETTAKKT